MGYFGTTDTWDTCVMGLKTMFLMFGNGRLYLSGNFKHLECLMIIKRKLKTVSCYEVAP
jgi:hypothetical protein